MVFNAASMIRAVFLVFDDSILIILYHQHVTVSATYHVIQRREVETFEGKCIRVPHQALHGSAELEVVRDFER